VRIDVLHVADCANVERTRARLREALAGVGLTVDIRDVEVATPAEAEQAGMRGSPTILIDGRDPFAVDAAETSLSCRLYHTADGFDGAPTVAQLHEVLVAEAGSAGRPRGAVNDTGRGDAAFQLLAAGFAAIWQGRPVRPAELLDGRGDLASEITAELASQGRAEVDGAGQLTGIHGLTLRTTRHRFVHHQRDHRTWCAFDSVGIPAALGLNATAHTDCPTCGQALIVDIVGGIPRRDGPVVWLPTHSGGNVVAEFCASADLFCSLEHLHDRIDTVRAHGRVASLAAAAGLGRAAWADVAGIDLA